MFWVLLALILVVGGLLAIRRRRGYRAADEEPWRASLEEGEDPPLQLDEIRKAEDEWLETSSWEDLPDDEAWH